MEEYEEEDADANVNQKFRKMCYIQVRKVPTRIVSLVQNVINSGYSRAELDTHADNGVVGSDAVILEEYPDEMYPDEIYRVYGYRKDDGYVEMKMVRAALAYDDLDGTTVLLIFDQVFHDESLKHSLLNPNQMRNNGIKVDDVAKKYGGSHQIDTLAGTKINLQHVGCISYFHVRRPTDEELLNCVYIDMHSDFWDPTEDLEVSVDAVYKADRESDSNILAKRWLLNEDTVKKTLNITTRLATKVHHGEARYGRYGHRFRWLSR